MIDLSELLAQALDDFGLPAALDGKPVTVLFYPGRSAADPYVQDRGHAGPRVQMLSAAAAGVDLSAAVLTIAAADYRVVRSRLLGGELTLYLREA